jgi:hypothetical protein
MEYRKITDEERGMRKNDPVVAALVCTLNRLPKIYSTIIKKNELISMIVENLIYEAYKAGYDILGEIDNSVVLMDFLSENRKVSLGMSLRNFLMLAAIDMGVPKYEAKHHSFVEGLYEQFSYVKKHFY